MVKQLAPEPTEFQMSNDDFPALPGTSTSASATPASNGAYSKTPTSNTLNGRTPTSNVANSKTSQAASATSVTGNHIDAASTVEVRPMSGSSNSSVADVSPSLLTWTRLRTRFSITTVLSAVIFSAWHFSPMSGTAALPSQVFLELRPRWQDS